MTDEQVIRDAWEAFFESEVPSRDRALTHFDLFEAGYRAGRVDAICELQPDAVIVNLIESQTEPTARRAGAFPR